MKTNLISISVLAMSLASVSAASITVDTVGTINGNGRTILETTGSTVTSTAFIADIATAYANNTGGVMNFEANPMFVQNNDTITLNYGVSLTNSLDLTYNSANAIDSGDIPGEATSGDRVLGLVGGADTRTFTPDKGLLEIGIFSTDRGDAGRLPVLTVTYFDTTNASTSGANADDVYFHGFKTSADNPIVSFSLSQNNFLRYDDLGFVVVPEPSSALLLGIGGVAAFIRRRR